MDLTGNSCPKPTLFRHQIDDLKLLYSTSGLVFWLGIWWIWLQPGMHFMVLPSRSCSFFLGRYVLAAQGKRHSRPKGCRLSPSAPFALCWNGWYLDAKMIRSHVPERGRYAAECNLAQSSNTAAAQGKTGFTTA
jgi:hypothetical protein